MNLITAGICEQKIKSEPDRLASLGEKNKSSILIKRKTVSVVSFSRTGQLRANVPKEERTSNLVGYGLKCECIP